MYQSWVTSYVSQASARFAGETLYGRELPCETPASASEHPNSFVSFRYVMNVFDINGAVRCGPHYMFLMEVLLAPPLSLSHFS